MKIPIVAIAGTHEYKGKEYTNPLDVLESAKYIIQLKHNSFSFSKSSKHILHAFISLVYFILFPYLNTFKI